ncbi:ribonuclease HII [Flagellimonas crocea]|uniref:ribonuclease HII n=1 Tax=Flagellimonas crocea TaxID=3067311 RepID=UPI00296FE5F5|nr:ribonuclease HII [Muricauda sp. DH64]
MLKSCYRTHLEAGTDEAGRGCLAGPVTAAAITLPKNFNHDMLNDSKQLSETKRSFLKPFLEKEAVSFSVCHVFQDEIDEINILNASFLAMHRAIEKLSPSPDFIIVDGNRFKPYPNIKHECIIKGDGKYMSIAAASVLAKTYRDEYMAKIHEEFPMYNWKKNKGYPTKEHREAIRKYGLTKYHRKSFRQLPDQLTLDI